MWKVLRGLVVIAAVLAAASSPTLSRGEWYDYYEEALQALDTGNHERAVELLDAALAQKKRSGYFRTYGNNYIRYVPHFYLGVAHHDAGNCARSLESFDRSEAAEETASTPVLATRLRSLRSACATRLAAERAQVQEAVKPPAEPAAIEAPEPVIPGPDPQLVERGLRAYLQGHFEESVRIFGELAGATPQSARVRLLLGMALHGSWVMSGETNDELIDQSRQELRNAARLDPDLTPDPAWCPPRVVAIYRTLR